MRKIYGYWVICNDSGEVIHRIANHYDPSSGAFDRAEMGVIRKTDLDRFTVGYEPLSPEPRPGDLGRHYGEVMRAPTRLSRKGEEALLRRLTER